MSAACERVAVVGLGKLGYVMAVVMAAAGHEVVGVDVDKNRTMALSSAIPLVPEPGLVELLKGQGRTRLHGTTDFEEAVTQSDIAFVVVPTPTGTGGEFDSGYVIDAVTSIGKAIASCHEHWYTVVISSTVMPGSTQGPIREALEAASGRTVGEAVGLCYSPEFIALGSVVQDMQHPDLVLVGADDDRSADDAFGVLQTVVRSEPALSRLSTLDAEIAKLSVNAFVTMKISFANTLAEICERHPGADALRVVNAIGADRRIGPAYLKPGGAYGGPCFPRDTEAFEAFAGRVGLLAPLAEATRRVNDHQAVRLVDRLIQEDQISVLGLTYKVGTPVVERSFGFELLHLLWEAGIRTVTYDPRADQQPSEGTVALSGQACVDASEVVIIATAWPEFAELDYRETLVIDIWGLLPPAPNVKRFGKG